MINKRGFSLLEVMIAIAILLVGVISILSLITSTINVNRLAQNKFIAAMLAQEGLELVHNRRDNNWHQNLTWNNNLQIPEFQYGVFTRTVTISNISANEVGVSSAVTWTQGSITRTLSAEDHLFNWK